VLGGIKLFFTVVFLLTVVGWALLTDKRRWRSLTAISLISLVTALIAELIAQAVLLWDFVGDEHWLFISLSNASSYSLITYLFIQWYPSRLNKQWKGAYWLAWTTFTIILEYGYVATGHMNYYPNWSLWRSYLADWLLYGLFFNIYRVFRLSRLDA
jgi:hypothetical protein